MFQVREDVPVGHVVGTVTGSDKSTLEIADNTGLHITYTLTSIPSTIEGVFEIDQITGSLVVAQMLDREQQYEYNLEIRALDTTSSNNPQSSAVTVKVEISDVNDNAPMWLVDPVIIYVAENIPIRSVVYNFTAFDADSGSYGDVHYKIIKQIPADVETFLIDPLTGTLTLKSSIDYEELNEYLLVVEAADQAHNVSERLSSSVTARIIVTDVNDNSPVFVTPSSEDFTLHLSDVTMVGQTIMHVVAIDKDSGPNGQVVYSILSGNEDGFYNMDQNSGHIELVKPLLDVNSMGHHKYINNVLSNGIFTLLISASDTGIPPKETRFTMKIVVQGSSSNPPTFLESVYHANISENVQAGSFVVRVAAKSFLNGMSK